MVTRDSSACMKTLWYNLSRKHTLEPNITSIGKPVAKLVVCISKMAVTTIFDFIEPQIEAFDPQTPTALA